MTDESEDPGQTDVNQDPEPDSWCECQGSDERYCALHGDGDEDYYGRRWA